MANPSDLHDSQNGDKPWPFETPLPPGADGTDPPLRAADEIEHNWIAAEAYRIAGSRGFPPNADMEHWLEAERNLKSIR